MTTNTSHKRYRVTQISQCNGTVVRDYRFRAVAKFGAWVYGGSAVDGTERFAISFERI
jgi:hypothetical protein